MQLKESDKLSRLKNEESMGGLVRTVDAIINVVSSADPDLTTVNRLQYTSATLIASRFSPRKPRTNRNTGEHKGRPQKQCPKWRYMTWGEISTITQYINGNRSQSLRKWLQTVIKWNEVPADGLQNLRNYKQVLKQWLQAITQRPQRHTKRSEQYRQNKIFHENEKRFYRKRLSWKTTTPTGDQAVLAGYAETRGRAQYVYQDDEGSKGRTERLMPDGMGELTVEELRPT